MAEVMKLQEIDDYIVGKTPGSWHCDARLGSGTFGIIHIWSNVKDELVEKITTKQLRMPTGDPANSKKYEEKWCQEVKMFSSLCHENIVRVFELPPDIKAFFSSQSSSFDAPILCMEFCDNGSLRSILNRTENHRGMSETECLTILKHVTSGLEYLHQRKIIHRDLKPENIVSKLNNARNHDGKQSTNTYKIIDLGFAKELGPKSLTSSILGTLQYAAPELFTSETYNKSVDFWSLGFMAHEIMTGLRPFFHNNVPKAGTKDWVNLLSMKSRETISIQFSPETKANINVKYVKPNVNPTSNNPFEEHENPFEDMNSKGFEASKSLGTYNRLSKTFNEDFICWLQMLLEMDPQKRGHASSSPRNLQNKHEEQHEVFSAINKIMIKTRIKLILMNLTRLDIVLSDSSCPAYYNNLQSFKMSIENICGISTHDLLLLTSNGRNLKSNDDFSTFVKEMNEGKELNTLFAYDLRFDDKRNCSVQPKISPSLLSMLKNPKQEVTHESKMSLATQIYWFIREEICTMEALKDANTRFINNLLRLDAENFLDKQDDIQRLSEKALIKLEFFIESLLYDLDQLSDLQQAISTSDVVDSWRNTQTDLQEKVETLSNKRSKLCIIAEHCKTMYEEILGSDVDISDLKVFESQFYKKMETVKKTKGLNDEASAATIQNNVDFAQVLAKFLKQRGIILGKHCTRYSKMLNNYMNIEDLLKSQLILKEEYKICLTTITKYQLRRQLHCWKLLRKSLNQVNTTSDVMNTLRMNTAEDCNVINEEMENSKRLIYENNALWDEMSTLMKKF